MQQETILLATLNHNLPDWTDNLVLQLRKDPVFNESCELFVLDNGSTTKLADSTTAALEQNIFFGGGFNVVLDYFLNKTSHSWLYFLNNDLVFHGPSFIRTSYEEAKWYSADVYSPSIINASKEQCHWKQMWNWGSLYGREVKWIDFQSPLISRRVLEKIKQYPMELVYGWGLDFYTGIVCQENSYRTFVSDTNTICHMNSLTFKENKISIGVNEFCQAAEKGMYDHFTSKGNDYYQNYLQLRSYGENYSWNEESYNSAYPTKTMQNILN